MLSFKAIIALLLGLCAAGLPAVSAQKLDSLPPPVYLTLSGGFGPLAVNDSYIALTPQKGYVSQFVIGVKSLHKKRFNDFRLRLFMANISGRYPDIKFYNGVHLINNYGFPVYESPNQHLRLYVGVEFQINAGLMSRDYETNNNQSYNVACDLSPSFTLSYNFPVGGHRLEIREHLSVPLIGIAFMPDYGLPFALQEDQRYVVHPHFTAPHNMWSVYNNLEVTWQPYRHTKPTRFSAGLGFECFGQRISVEDVSFQTSFMLLNVGVNIRLTK